MALSGILHVMLARIYVKINLAKEEAIKLPEFKQLLLYCPMTVGFNNLNDLLQTGISQHSEIF